MNSRSVVQVHSVLSSIRSARLYSSLAEAAGAAVDPPDFLDDKERAIFLELKEELQPTALEVCDVFRAKMQ